MNDPKRRFSPDPAHVRPGQVATLKSRATRSFAIALGAALLISSCTSPNHLSPSTAPGVSPAGLAGGQVAFVRHGSGPDASGTVVPTCAIFVMRPDGSGLRALTERLAPEGYCDGSPTLSPDGSAIAFAREDWTGTPENGTLVCRIYVIRQDGSDLRALTDGPCDRSPTWSPDGSAIAFDGFSLSDQGNHIFRVNRDGSGLMQLTSSRFDSSPAWSPDGARIAFLRSGDMSGVYVVKTDGSELTRLTPAGQSWEDVVASLSWSPDGTRIVMTLTGSGECPGSALSIMNADGSGITPLNRLPPELVAPGWTVGSVAWSGDGSHIAFGAGNCGDDPGTAVVVLATDRLNAVSVTNGLWRPAWSPDGRRIAGEGSHGIAVMDLDGTNLRQLTNDSDFEPTWR